MGDKLLKASTFIGEERTTQKKEKGARTAGETMIGTFGFVLI